MTKKVYIDNLEFTILKMSAFDSMLMLGSLTKTLSPLFDELYNSDLLKKGDIADISNEVALKEFLKLAPKIDMEAMVNLIEKLVKNARFENVPVSTKDVAFSSKITTLFKLAFEIAKEEYTPFLSSLGVDLSKMTE